jgi:hypothetical protein
MITTKGEKKKGFFALAQKCLKKILKCRLIVPSYEKKYNLRLGLTRRGAKKYFHFFLLRPS